MIDIMGWGKNAHTWKSATLKICLESVDHLQGGVKVSNHWASNLMESSIDLSRVPKYRSHLGPPNTHRKYRNITTQRRRG